MFWRMVLREPPPSVFGLKAIAVCDATRKNGLHALTSDIVYSKDAASPLAQNREPVQRNPQARHPAAPSVRFLLNRRALRPGAPSKIPAVVSIEQTLYWTSEASPLFTALTESGLFARSQKGIPKYPVERIAEPDVFCRVYAYFGTNGRTKCSQTTFIRERTQHRAVRRRAHRLRSGPLETFSEQHRCVSQVHDLHAGRRDGGASAGVGTSSIRPVGSQSRLSEDYRFDRTSRATHSDCPENQLLSAHQEEWRRPKPPPRLAVVVRSLAAPKVRSGAVHS